MAAPAEIQRRNNLNGTLQDVRELLDEALEAERRELFPDPSDDARFGEAQLDALPPGTAAAVNELAEYDWRSEEGSEKYQEIRDLLGQELMDSRFQGMKQALQNAGPEDVERISEMMSDLNDLLAAHARWRGHDRAVRRVHGQARRVLPGEPAQHRRADRRAGRPCRRGAADDELDVGRAAGRAGRTDPPGVRRPAAGAQLSRLDAHLRALRPGEDWTGSERFRGKNPMGMGEGAQAMQDLAELDALAEQLGQSYPGARMEDIDLDALSRQLGEDAGVDARRLAELERELRSQGLFERAPDGTLRLSPKALRRLGETALVDVVDALRARRGERETALAGAAGEPTGSTRAWRFGDTEPWDVSRTVRNAVLRTASVGERAVRLDVEDVEMVETEQRARAAVALCVDTSWSMVQDGRWLPMKRTALALHQLITTRFRTDALQLITFGRHAARWSIGELIALEGAWEQGTNLHHALLLAGRHLRRHPDAQPVVLVVTDGEPTAHLESDGEAVFNYPPKPRTLGKTLFEVDGLAKLGASVTVFLLGDDPRLEAFVDVIARR